MTRDDYAIRIAAERLRSCVNDPELTEVQAAIVVHLVLIAFRDPERTRAEMDQEQADEADEAAAAAVLARDEQLFDERLW